MHTKRSVRVWIVTALMALTTIIGAALPSAIRLSRMMFARPFITQPLCVSPLPCSR